MAAKVKKGCVYLMALVLAMASLSFAIMTNVHAADASDACTVSVDFTSQYDSQFLHAPQFGYEVSSDLAEDYGYDAYDEVENAVSVLDVLVAAHKLHYGDAFTPQSATQYLTFDNTGTLSKQFGVQNYPNDFFLNHVFANDGTRNPYNINEYNRTEAGTQAVQNGDLVEFFFYEDFDYCDTYNWFVDANGVYSRTFEMTAGEDITLKLKGIDNSYIAKYRDEGALIASAEADPVYGAQIYLVNPGTGVLTAIENATTNRNGVVTLNFDTPGTYIITAGTGNAEYTQIMSLTTINVEEAPAAAPQFGKHRLSLSDEIGVQYRVSFPEGFDRDSCYVVFTNTKDGKTSTVQYKNAVKASDYDSTGDVYFGFRLNALEIADEIAATMYYGDGKSVTAEPYSVMTYITKMRETYDSESSLVKLVDALQAYGHYLQDGTGWTDNKTHTAIAAPARYQQLTNADIETAKTGVSSMVTHKSIENTGIVDAKVRLSLTDKTVVDVSYKLAAGVTITNRSDYSIRQIDGEDYYMFRSKPIGPKALGDEIESKIFKVTLSDGTTATVLCSPMSYVNSMLNKETVTTKQKYALTAYYYYYVAADNYK